LILRTNDATSAAVLGIRLQIDALPATKGFERRATTTAVDATKPAAVDFVGALNERIEETSRAPEAARKEKET